MKPWNSHNQRKPPKCLYKAFGRVQTLQNLIFDDKNSIKNSYFFWCLILDVIFCHFGVSWCQKARFWDPLGAQLGTKWRPKSPKSRQKAQKKHPGRSLFVALENDLLPISLLERSWAPFWSILGPLGSKIMDFRIIFFTFSFWTDVAKINQKSAKIW